MPKPSDLRPNPPKIGGGEYGDAVIGSEGRGADIPQKTKLEWIAWAKEKYGFPSTEYSKWYRETFGATGGASSGGAVPGEGAGGPEEAVDAYDELGPVPEAAPPSMAMLRRYALGEMDISSRAAAIQSGAASQRLGGLNPSARAQALSEISRGGSGMVGQGTGAAGAMANQNALASYQGAMQNRGMLGNAIQQALNQGYTMSQIGLQHRNAMEMARYNYDMQRQQQQRRGGFWGALGGIAGTVLGGPFGGYLGKRLFNSGNRKYGGQNSGWYSGPGYGNYGGQDSYSRQWDGYG